MAEENTNPAPSGPAQPEGVDADLNRLRLYVVEEQQEQAKAEQAAQPQPGEPGGGARAADDVLDADEEVKLTPMEAVRGMIELCVMPAEMAGMQRVAAIWTPDKIEGLAELLLPVLMKYSIGRRLVEFFQDGMGVAELALFMYAKPLIVSTITAAKLDIEELRKAATEATPGNAS